MDKSVETELVFYCKIGDKEGLKQADHVEHHVQIESRLLNGNKTRVRQITQPGQTEPQYIYTIKKKAPSNPQEGNESLVQASTEYSCEVDKKFFDTFSEIIEQRIEKTRYTFKDRPVRISIGGVQTPLIIPGVNYEVDCFTTNGESVEWVKIDMEIDSINEYLDTHYSDLNEIKFNIKLSALPLKCYDIIFPPLASEEQKNLVKELWKTKFTQQF